MLPIYDGPTRTGVSTLEQWARGPLTALAQRSGILVQPLKNIAAAPPLAPRVNHNRWIVDCPNCGGAEFLWPEGLMMCASCWNGDVDGQWRRVSNPANRNEIDEVLMIRPVPGTRNWNRNESIEDLQQENRKHGLPDKKRA